MSFLFASLLNNSLPTPSVAINIQQDNPREVTLKLTNTNTQDLTNFTLIFDESSPLLILPSSSCTQISLINPLTQNSSCDLVLKTAVAKAPQSLNVPLAINYTSANGQNGTLKFLARSSTYLYAGTLNNIERWDGQHWSTLGDNINKVQALQFDPNGVLYAGTQNGVYAWRDNTWIIVGEHPPIGITTLGFDQTGALYAGSSTLGIQVLIPGQVTWQTLGINGPKSITSMIFAKKNLYVGTNNATEVWDGQSWNLTPGAPLMGSVAFAYDSRENLLYSGTDDGKVHSLNLTSNQGWDTIGQPGGIYDLVDTLNISNQHQLIAGIDNNENSIQANAANAQWHTFGNGAPNYVTTLIHDAQGNFYAANYGRGSNIFVLKPNDTMTWQAIPDAPQNTFVNALILGAELQIENLALLD